MGRSAAPIVLLRRSSIVLVAIWLLAGCAMPKNTPAQELALERWQKCSHASTVRLKEIRPNGEIWVFYEDPGRFAEWQACNRAAYLEQQKAGGLSSIQTSSLSKKLVSWSGMPTSPTPRHHQGRT